MHNRIEKTLELNKKTQDSWLEVYSKVQLGGLPLDKPYDVLQECSVREINERLIATFLLVDSLRSIEDAATSLVIPRLKSVDEMLNQIFQQCQSLLNQTAEFSEGFSLNDPGGNLQLQVMVGGSAVLSWGLHAALPTIGKQQMTLFDQMTLALRFRRYKGVGLFVEKSRELQLLAEELANLVRESKPLAKELMELRDSAKIALDESKSEQEKSTGFREELEEMVPNAQSKVDEIEAKLARTKEITKISDALEIKVNEYDSSFSAFQESLDSRVSAHQKFEQNAKEVKVQLEEREAEIARLIEKSDSMIKGATSAGLATSLDETRAAYEKRLSSTGWGFLVSTVILFICALPIVVQLVPGPWQAWFTDINNNGVDPWLSMLGKIVILLPATWATAFFAGNYAELFHLSREYAHKAAMAKAVDGFKREAPEYKEEIVAGVFMEIRDNPGSRKSPEPASPQNPLSKRILERLLDAIKSKSSDSTKT
ncbi:hypothetical protein ACBP93_00930 [Paenalcaligenes hominis]|uniref:hypothetical protein n=1 Tax=Paenalcaligenes hominis TaxID=643674 RepID=UPI0035243BD0